MVQELDHGGSRNMNEQDSNLAPQQPDADDSQEWAIEPTGAPESFVALLTIACFMVTLLRPLT